MRFVAIPKRAKGDTGAADTTATDQIGSAMTGAVSDFIRGIGAVTLAQYQTKVAGEPATKPANAPVQSTSTMKLFFSSLTPVQWIGIGIGVLGLMFIIFRRR